MKTLSRAAGAVLDALTRDLPVGVSRKVDNSHGTFMAVHVDRLGERTYSLAHDFKMNGDLVCDPDGVFVRTDAGWLPVALQLCTGHYTRALELDESERPARVDARAFAELSHFAAMWLRNIADQQGGIARLTTDISRDT